MSTAESSGRPSRIGGHSWLAWAGVGALAVAVRAVHVWAIRQTPLFQLPLGDARAFDAWARQIAAGDWLGGAVFYQAPLYPHLMAVVYAAGGDLFAVRVLQVCLAAVACVLLGLAGSRFFSPAVGLVAAAALAVWPSAVFADALIERSALDAFLSCLLLFLLSARTAGAWRWFAVGSTLGALVLTREHALVFAPLVLGALVLGGRPAAVRRGPAAAAFLVGVALLVLPVAGRDRVGGGEWHLTPANFGPSLYIGNNASATGLYQPLRFGRTDARDEQVDAIRLAERALGRPLSPGAASRYWSGRAADFIRTQPGRWLDLLGRKAVLLINRVEVGDAEDQYTYAEWSPPLAVLGPWLHFGILAPLAAAGLVLAWPRRRDVALPAAMLGAYALSVVATFVTARLRQPLLPLLLLFAAAAVVDGWRLARAGRWRLVALAALAAAAVAVPANRIVITEARVRAATLYHIGQALEERQGGLETAIEFYSRALGADPTYALAHNNLGAALQRRGEPDRALAYLTRAIRLQPGTGEFHYNLGTALAALGDPDGAAAAYRRALERDPANADAHNNLGGLAFGRDDMDAAERGFTAALQIDPEHTQAMGNLGAVYLRRGETDRAIETFRAALARDPTLRAPRQNLVRALTEAGRDQEAAAERARLGADPEPAP